MQDDLTTRIWGVAAAAAIVAFIILKWLAQYGFWPALILAILVGLLVALLLWIFRTRAAETAAAARPASAPASAPAAVTSSPAASEPSDPPPPAAAKLETQVEDEMEDEHPTEPGTAEEVDSVPARPAPKAAARPATRATGRGRKAEAADPRPSPRPATRKPQPAEKPAAPAKKPAAKAKAAGADDLKQIKGVGPKIEGQLHGMGVTSFAQIAAWTEADIARVSEALKFSGRIERDDWIAQAKTLAAGGETEFSGRVKKGDVY